MFSAESPSDDTNDEFLRDRALITIYFDVGLKFYAFGEEVCLLVRATLSLGLNVDDLLLLDLDESKAANFSVIVWLCYILIRLKI